MNIFNSLAHIFMTVTSTEVFRRREPKKFPLSFDASEGKQTSFILILIWKPPPNYFLKRTKKYRCISYFSPFPFCFLLLFFFFPFLYCPVLFWVCKYARNLNSNCSLEICAQKEHVDIGFLSVALPNAQSRFQKYQYSAGCVQAV